MWSLDTILLAVTQVTRLVGAVRDYRENKILEADIRIVLDRPDSVTDFLEDALTRPDRLIAAVPLAGEWLDPQTKLLKPDCPESVRARIKVFGREEFLRRQAAAGAAGFIPFDKETATVIAHWRSGEEPATPLHRFGLTVLGIALETAAANPKIFKAGKNGEKLISAFLSNTADLLPSGDDPRDFRVGFAERTASILLTAGARVIEENAELIWDQTRLQELGRAMIKPLKARLEEALRGEGTAKAYQLLKIEDFREELLAPLTHAALGVVARHQKAFLGEAFATDNTLGALTEAFIDVALDERNKGHISRAFTPTGMVHLYERTLNVIAEKPQLFIHGRSAPTAMAQNVLAGVAQALTNLEGAPFQRDVTGHVAAAALEAVAEGLPTILTSDNPWDQVGVNVLKSIMAGFAAGVREGDQNPFARIFGPDQGVEVVRLIAAQAALTPGMITGRDVNPEVSRIAQYVAELISQPSAELLSPTMWHGVLGAILREASANPGTLFSIEGDGPGGQLAIHLVTDLFAVAAQAYDEAGRTRTASLRLFGETLADAAQTVARAAVRNAQAALSEEGRAAARKLVENLNALAKDENRKLSDHDWRFLYRTWIAQVIETGAAPDSAALINTLYLRQQQSNAATGGAQDDQGQNEGQDEGEAGGAEGESGGATG